MRVESLFIVFSYIQLRLVHGSDYSKNPCQNDITHCQLTRFLADARSYPFMVELSVNKRHQCAGVIVEEYWILTAAHCLTKHKCENIAVIPAIDDPRKPTSELYATECYPHEKFDNLTLANDIGLIRLPVNILKSGRLQMVTLPTPGSYYPPNTKAITVGWGRTKGASTTFDFVQGVVFIGDDVKCKNSLHVLGLYSYAVQDGKVPEGIMCTYEVLAKYHKTCLGDSGAPILVNGVLVGILSSGIDVASFRVCKPTIAKIEVKVHDYLSWVYAYIDPYSSWDKLIPDNKTEYDLPFTVDEERMKALFLLSNYLYETGHE